MCRSPHHTHGESTAFASMLRMAPPAMGGLCPPPCGRLSLARASLCSGLNAVCSRIAKGCAFCALARRSAARRRPRRPGGLPLALLRGRSASAPPSRGRPPSAGPPARAPGAAVRPRRVPLRGARRICRGFGRRSSAPSAAQSARAGRARFARAPFPAPRARGRRRFVRLLAAFLRVRAVALAMLALPPSRVRAIEQLFEFRPIGRGIQSWWLRHPGFAGAAYMRTAIALAYPHAPQSLSANAYNIVTSGLSC